VRKALVLDTNLFVLLVVGAAGEELVEAHRRLSGYTREHYRWLRDIVRTAPKVVCTPHIPAETSNFLRQGGANVARRCMEQFSRLIGSAGEIWRPASELATADPFIRLGLTDAAILDLAPEDHILLTVDFDLDGAARKRGFEVQNPTRLFHEGPGLGRTKRKRPRTTRKKR